MADAKRILITGASGFTGPYMARVLKQPGVKIIGVSNNKSSIDDTFDEAYATDLTNKAAVEDLVAGAAPTHVVHLAGISFVGHEDLNQFYSVNVVGTENLLMALCESKSEIANVLISSSANVYGVPSQEGGITEAEELRPINHYAISKLASEFVARKFMDKLHITIARPFNYIGYGQNQSFVIPKIVQAFASGESTLELGSLDVSRDFTYVGDTVRAYSSLLYSDDCIGGAFNVCSGFAVSLLEVIDIMRQISGETLEVVTNPLFVRKHEIKSLHGANDKIRSYTGWEPKTTIEATLREMYKCYVLNL